MQARVRACPLAAVRKGANATSAKLTSAEASQDHAEEQEYVRIGKGSLVNRILYQLGIGCDVLQSLGGWWASGE
jgi:hypothetical protein